MLNIGVIFLRRYAAVTLFEPENYLPDAECT